MKALVCFLLAGAVAIFSTLPFATAQVANGAKRGFTVTDLDNPGVTGHTVFRIDLDHPESTVAMGVSNVKQELEGLYSIDVDGDITSRLKGVAENPDSTSSQDPSIQVDLTEPAVDDTKLGTPECETNIDFGTEAGSAWNHLTGKIYSVASDDRPAGTGTPPAPPTSPHTRLYELNSCGEQIDILDTTTNEDVVDGFYIDGLAVGGDGTLYGSDARLSDALWKFNFVSGDWEFVGAFDPPGSEDLAEDTGLANWRGANGDETNLYMITEGEGGSRVGRLWTVDHNSGAAALAGANGELRLAVSGAEVPEDLEGFDIPYRPLIDEQ